ncbi:hypothetical protein [Prosthecobacter sp.]|jgi:hypothetical protein|uniref:hypothetical protein n=1 Tax=Prosthecobacter sp. TaxID=1965333 RepID=UPI0037CAECBF
MTNTFRSLLLLAATAVMASTAQAAPITYNFTGTYAGGDTYFGTTVTGTITLDLTAAPSSSDDSQAEWRNVPGIKITATTTNFTGGTGKIAGALVDDTVVQQVSASPLPPGFGGPTHLSWNWFGFSQLDGSDAQGISIDGNGLPYSQLDTLSHLINPVAPPLSFTGITIYDSTHQASFELGAFTPVATNILIDGKDTGIKDITYQGQSVSAILAGYAASAKNHGDYVSSVEKLMEKLLKAKLLTKAQAETLKKAAEKSSIGQKPKKEKEDKEDKGKSDKDDDDNNDD